MDGRGGEVTLGWVKNERKESGEKGWRVVRGREEGRDEQVERTKANGQARQGKQAVSDYKDGQTRQRAGQERQASRKTSVSKRT